jgi:signal transduction histidine kinase
VDREADPDEILGTVAGLTSVIVVGPADAVAVARWRASGALEYAADPLGVDAPRLIAACSLAVDLATLRADSERLAALARLALDPPGPSDLFDRLGAELGALGIAEAWQAALVEGDEWRVGGHWPHPDAWVGTIEPSVARPKMEGRELVLLLGRPEAPAAVLRLRLREDPDRFTVGVVQALASVAGWGLAARPTTLPLPSDGDRMGAALHELRAPLTVLLGQGQLIERGLLAPVEEPVRAAAEAIVSQARRLRDLIDAMDPRRDC